MADKKSDSVAHFFGGTDLDQPANVNFSLENTDDGATDDDANFEGEIAVDVYQTETSVVIVTPIAGIDPDDIEIAATDESITISGERSAGYEREGEHVFTQEIYWGTFSRTVVLPVPCEVDKADASFKHGVLTIAIPKTAKAKKHTIKVNTTS